MARLFRHDVVDSTNDSAFEALAAGRARDGDVHVARAQRAGRGRRGRRWESPRDEGLFLSYVHRPPAGPDGLQAALLTMAAGLGTLDAVRALDAVRGAADTRLVWPNDLFAGDAKLAGILVEARGLDPTRPDCVIGIGINVRQRRFSPGLSAEREVTSLALLGLEVDTDEVLSSVLRHLPPRLAAARDDPTGLCEDYLDATGLRGARVRVEVGDEEIDGVLAGLDPVRGLAVSRPRGHERWVELAHVRAVVSPPLSV